MPSNLYTFARQFLCNRLYYYYHWYYCYHYYYYASFMTSFVVIRPPVLSLWNNLKSAPPLEQIFEPSFRRYLINQSPGPRIISFRPKNWGRNPYVFWTLSFTRISKKLLQYFTWTVYSTIYFKLWQNCFTVMTLLFLQLWHLQYFMAWPLLRYNYINGKEELPATNYYFDNAHKSSNSSETWWV